MLCKFPLKHVLYDDLPCMSAWTAARRFNNFLIDTNQAQSYAEGAGLGCGVRAGFEGVP